MWIVYQIPTILFAIFVIFIFWVEWLARNDPDDTQTNEREKIMNQPKITETELQMLFKHFCNLTGRPVIDPNEKESTIWKWRLSRSFFDGSFIIIKVVEGGEHQCPFGERGLSADEMWAVLYFAVKSHEEQMSRQAPSWIINPDAEHPVTLTDQPLHDESDGICTCPLPITGGGHVEYCFYCKKQTGN